MNTFIRTYFVGIPVLFVTLTLTACGPATNRGIPKAAVIGTVTINGQPVKEGVVTLSSLETGIGASVKIEPPGEFKIVDGIELGNYQVSIAPPAGEDNAGAPAPVKKPEPSEIANKYWSAHSSGLTATIQKGENRLKFELDPAPAVKK